MAETSIQWTDHSINPIRARLKSDPSKVGHFCQMCSSGCAHCYSSNTQRRFNMPAFAGEGKLKPLPVIDANGCVSVGDDIEVFLDESKLAEVLRRKKPTKYFWADMTDLFGSWVPDEWIDKCFATMILSRQHTHQVLTKRAGRMQEYMSRVGKIRDFDELCAFPLARKTMALSNSLGHPFWQNAKLEFLEEQWPKKNIWLGVSVENQAAADERIPHLLRTPAAIRFLSVEPLLWPVDFNALSEAGWNFNALSGLRENPFGAVVTRDKGPKIDWVIVGGESGHNARPCRPEWIRSIVEQCKSAGVSCFVKQMGGNVVTRNDMIDDAFNNGESGWPEPEVEHHINGFREDYQGADCRIRLTDRKGADMAEWPKDLRVREFPSVAEVNS